MAQVVPLVIGLLQTVAAHPILAGALIGGATGGARDGLEGAVKGAGLGALGGWGGSALGGALGGAGGGAAGGGAGGAAGGGALGSALGSTIPAVEGLVIPGFSALAGVPALAGGALGGAIGGSGASGARAGIRGNTGSGTGGGEYVPDAPGIEVIGDAGGGIGEGLGAAGGGLISNIPVARNQPVTSEEITVTPDQNTGPPIPTLDEVDVVGRRQPNPVNDPGSLYDLIGDLLPTLLPTPGSLYKPDAPPVQSAQDMPNLNTGGQPQTITGGAGRVAAPTAALSISGPAAAGGGAGAGGIGLANAGALKPQIYPWTQAAAGAPGMATSGASFTQSAGGAGGGVPPMGGGTQSGLGGSMQGPRQTNIKSAAA